MNNSKRFLLALAAGVLAAAPAFAVEPITPTSPLLAQEGRDLENILRDRPYLSTFRAFTEQAGVNAPLRTPGTDNKGYTIFVPSNNAWAKLPPQVLGELQRNRDLLEQVVKYHIVAGTWTAGEIKDGMSAGSLQGEAIPLSLSGKNVGVGGAYVIEADQRASNGVVHIIDRVLLPPTIRNDLNRRALLPLTDQRAEMLARQPDALAGRNVNNSTTRGLTGGAANQGNSSFGIGGNVSTTGEGAIRTGSGARLGRPARIANLPRAAGLANVLGETSNLSMLNRLIGDAGLADTLASGTYTVFAPTDAAFEMLPSMARDAIVNDRDLLRQVLLYHVVRGETTSDELKRGRIRSAQGGDLMVKVGAKGAAKVNNAVVLDTDMMARNGAVHSINRVLIPASVMSSLRAKGITIGD